jgi:hypothetical protein
MRLTKAELQWWESIPDDTIFECADCGKRDKKYYVQPQYREGFALCANCIAERNRQWRERRKAELAAMPRCVACKRRGTYRHGETYLCGRHLRELEAAMLRRHGMIAMIAGMGGSVRLSREEIVRLLQG